MSDVISLAVRLDDSGDHRIVGTIDQGFEPQQALVGKHLAAVVEGLIVVVTIAAQEVDLEHDHWVRELAIKNVAFAAFQANHVVVFYCLSIAHDPVTVARFLIWFLEFTSETNGVAHFRISPVCSPKICQMLHKCIAEARNTPWVINRHMIHSWCLGR